MRTGRGRRGARSLTGVLVGLMALGSWEASAGAEDPAALVQQLIQQVQQLQAQQEETQRQMKALMEEMTRIKGNAASAQVAQAPSSTEGSPQGDDFFEVPNTPVGSGSSTRVSSLAEALDFHGYLDLNYLDSQARGVTGNSTFDNNHLTLWTGWKIHEKVYAKAEIEYEHTTNIAAGGGGKDGEVKIEMAQIDLTPIPNLRFSLGSIIVPFGIEAEAHASPLNRLVTRPTPARRVIPGTWTDVGIWGNYTVPRIGELALFVINGDARSGSVARDSRNTTVKGNDGKSLGGRLRLNQLKAGLDFGLSYVQGKHDENNDYHSTRYGVHLAADVKQLFSLSRDLRLTGEWFWGQDEEGSARKGPDGGARNADLEGWYLQVAQGITPALEVIARFGQYNTDREVADNRFREFSLGLGYAPLPNLRFKMEYQWNKGQGPRDVDDNLLAGQAVVAW